MSKSQKTPTPVTKVVVGTNSNKLPWPQDKSGSTQELRRGIVRAIGRMSGSDESFDLVIETLEVGAAYAEARLAEQKREVKARLDAQRKAVAAAKALEENRVQAQIAANIKEIERLEAANEAASKDLPTAKAKAE